MIVVNMVFLQKNFCVLREEDILKHQMDAIERVSVVLSITEVEASMKWCPVPGCEYAIDFVAASGNYDVSCLCSFSFCRNVSSLLGIAYKNRASASMSL
ncbi:hypothetical protein F2Q69_00004406 [Brassica cretica]|uniref:IBR domain-containing protein n=1 Tax=Brassica cretica TaxID=69181 RepID=A0A8S9NTD6_BRACR|nr:hypothetical protein F2Q69_00004406 [Brassica cretica]